MHSRRSFLKQSVAMGLGMQGLGRVFAEAPATRSLGERVSARLDDDEAVGLGPLVSDPAGLLDLPEGFQYKGFSLVGDTMDDGLFVPGLHDGMAAFPGPQGTTALVRNHEMMPGKGGAFGAQLELLDKVDRERIYDQGHGEFIGLGGTTTMLYDTREQQLVEHWLSLAGTVRNCAGGPTPWGSWVTCEEAVFVPGKRFEKSHGWCFEVPADHHGLVDPIPLTAMGRMNHEAVAVDPRTGIVYLTEDREDSILYRFLPKKKGDLKSGGKLQALRVNEAPSLDTRNWHRFGNVPVGEALDASWVTIFRPEAPDDDLRYQGFHKGAACFARGEGIAYGDGAFFFTCTSGGRKRGGQIWKYVPSPHEGEREERGTPGKLTLFLEPNDAALVDMCDNITVAPWGDLIAAEDGKGTDRLFGVTPDAHVYPLASNARSEGEFAGPTFSPDGTTLFVNLQAEGITVAVTGPWERLRKG